MTVRCLSLCASQERFLNPLKFVKTSNVSADFYLVSLSKQIATFYSYSEEQSNHTLFLRDEVHS